MGWTAGGKERVSRLERAGLDLYGALLRLFPRRFRDDEAREALDTLRCMVRDEPGRTRRSLTLFRGLRRLPGALMREWWDTLRGADGRTNGPAHGPGPGGRGRMEGTVSNRGKSP